MYIEKEVKFEISDVDEVKKKLESVGLVCTKSEFQKTIRFDNKKELEKQGLFLRVRSGLKNTITLKSKLPNSFKGVRQRKEIEVSIENIEKMRLILNKLGFSDEKIMEKYRITYVSESCEIVIDKLPFGNFIEIEGEEKNIFNLIKKLGFDKKKIISKTYWDLFEEYKEKNNLLSLGKNIIFNNKKEVCKNNEKTF